VEGTTVAFWAELTAGAIAAAKYESGVEVNVLVVDTTPDAVDAELAAAAGAVVVFAADVVFEYDTAVVFRALAEDGLPVVVVAAECDSVDAGVTLLADVATAVAAAEYDMTEALMTLVAEVTVAVVAATECETVVGTGLTLGVAVEATAPGAGEAFTALVVATDGADVWTAVWVFAAAALLAAGVNGRVTGFGGFVAAAEYDITAGVVETLAVEADPPPAVVTGTVSATVCTFADGAVVLVTWLAAETLSSGVTVAGLANWPPPAGPLAS